MPAKVVEIKGMNELLRKLKTVQDLRSAKIGLKAGATHLKGIISKYPASTIANSPSNPSGHWYERGFGSKWIRKRAGGVGGRKTSQTLGRRWTQKSQMMGLQQVIGNNATYAPYVQSAEKQAKVHEMHGWKTDEDVINEEGKTVLNFVKDEVDKGLRSG